MGRAARARALGAQDKNVERAVLVNVKEGSLGGIRNPGQILGPFADDGKRALRRVGSSGRTELEGAQSRFEQEHPLVRGHQQIGVAIQIIVAGMHRRRPVALERCITEQNRFAR